MFGERKKATIELRSLSLDIEAARDRVNQGDFNGALDIYEQLSQAYPPQAVNVLAEAYEVLNAMPNRDRYSLYQSRFYDFGIRAGDKILDIGSGHIPFPLATHLSDISTTDDSYGRNGTPFKHADGKPVYEFNVENIPFGDNEFDFVYCSHVLEHSNDPERACKEIMRVGKRGYIETPARAKDLWLNSAKVSNHRWSVRAEGDVLVFLEYDAKEIEGLGCGILMSMHCSPKTDREKAFSALIHLKSAFMNTMFLWEGRFDCRVERGQTRGQNRCEGFVESNNFNRQKEQHSMGGGACNLGGEPRVHMPDKEQPEVLFEKAATLLGQKNFAESFKITESLASSNVRMPGLYFAKAIALSGMGRMGMAEFACRAELELYPGNVQAKEFLKQLQNFAGNGLITRLSEKPFTQSPESGRLGSSGGFAVGSRPKPARRSSYKRVYHYHIMKTGGTSINQAFCQLAYTGQMPPAKTSASIDQPSYKGEVVNMLVDRKISVVGNGYKIVRWGGVNSEGSDYFYGFCHKCVHELKLRPDTYTFTCLRDPVERAISRYKNLVWMHRENTLSQTYPYLEGVFKEELGSFLDLYETRYLFHQLRMFSQSINVDEAIENISKCDRILLLENFQQDFETLGNELDLELPFLYVRKGIEVDIRQRDIDRLREMMIYSSEFFEKVKKYVYDPRPMDIYLEKPFGVNREQVIV